MKAAFLKHSFPSKVTLHYGEQSLPSIKDHEVLVQVKASCVNPFDWKLYTSARKIMPILKAPFATMVLGQDIAGVITAVGPQVKNFKVGDKIFACQMALGGAYAEYAAVKEAALSHKPSYLSHEEAAAVPTSGLTAWKALTHKAKLKKDDHLLIIGASGGVGSFAVQIAKALGAKVTAVCSTANVEFVRSLGADQVIDYKKQSYLNNPERYDAIFDVAGRENLQRCLPLLKKTGSYISTEPNLTNIMNTIKTCFKQTPKAYVMAGFDNNGKELDNLKHFMETHQIKPVITKNYSLEKVHEAVRESQQGKTQGKILLSIS